MTTSLRHRKSNTFLRKFDTDIRLFHIEPCKIPKYKWSSYFASIFKRSKSKQNTNDINNNNNNNNKNDLSPYNNTFMDHQQVALDTKSEFEQDDHSSTKESMVYHQYIATLPSSPVSSLSPPPKHTMIIHRQHKSKSLMPIDISSYSKSSSTPIPKTYSSTPTLTITDTNNNNKVQSVTSSSSPFVPASSSPSTVTAIPRQYIPARSPILRLSLDFEHHHHHLNQFNHSRQSSAQSNDESIDLNYSHNINNNKICKKNILTTQNINDQEQGSITPPSLSSSNLIERRRQRNSLLLWKGPGILDLDHRSSFIDEGEEEEKGKEINELMMDFQQLDQQQQQQHHELDLSFSTTASTTFDHHYHHQKNNQIGKEKAHYDAIVASTLFHHRSSQEEQQQQRLKHQSLFIPSNNHHYPNSVTSSSIAPTIAFNPSPLNLPIYSKDTDQSLKHNDINNNTNNNKKPLIGLLDTPPSSAQLIDPNLSFSHLPSSPHSMISNELDSHL